MEPLMTELSKIYIEVVASECEGRNNCWPKPPCGSINAQEHVTTRTKNSSHFSDNGRGGGIGFVFKQISKFLQTRHVRPLFRFSISPILMHTSRDALKYCYQSSTQQWLLVF
jgi:hypothetical protein